jgi:hypothetical protein
MPLAVQQHPNWNRANEKEIKVGKQSVMVTMRMTNLMMMKMTTTE